VFFFRYRVTVSRELHIVFECPNLQGTTGRSSHKGVLMVLMQEECTVLHEELSFGVSGIPRHSSFILSRI